MRITKYLHSCLLVEEQDKTVLIDPGIFTYNAKVLQINKLNKLDYLLFTHEHPDHMYLPFVHELVARFPNVTIITNQSIVEILKNENIKATSTGDDIVSLTVAPHEKLWDKEPPENVAMSIFGKLTHVGDSLHFSKTDAVLALPIQAAWGSTTQAVEKALQVIPKFIIPIHDWMWKDEFRKGMYDRLTVFFKEKGIEFKSVEIGESIEI